MSNGLPVSRLITVSVNLSPSAAQFANFNSLLILGTSTAIDLVTRMRSYGSITEVGNDFTTTSPEYLAAVLWFEQAPQPTQLYIGRWANAASSGQLVGATLSAAQQMITNFTGITDGGLSITIDTNSVQHLTGISFAEVTNLNGVASAINGHLTGASIVWNATYKQFVVTSSTTGATSAVSFASVPASGTTDVSALMGLQAASSGAYVSPGQIAETALAAVQLFDDRFSDQWYALTALGAVDADHLAIAAYIEADSPAHFYGVSTQEAATLVASQTSDIGYQLKQLAYRKTATQFSSSNLYSVASLLGRILTTNYAGNNTVITLKFKQEPGIVPENLNTTQANALEGKNVNVFVAYNNDTAIIEQGVCASGDFIDTIIGVDWFANQLQTDAFNALYTSPTKIPQTDAGNHIIATALEAACIAAVNNGFLAPGTWNSGGFGQLQQGQFMAKGYYIFTPPISSQAQSDREARKSVPFQIAIKLAGAIHDVDVIVTVNR